MESGQYQRATRGRLPAWYLKQPRGYKGDQFCFRAFTVLATERDYTQGTGPIPWSKAVLYAEKSGFPPSLQMWFGELMLALDHEWRENLKEQRGKERKREERAERRKAAMKKGKGTRR